MIDKNVPMPSPGRAGSHGNARYPWREMAVGDSIFMKLPEAENMSAAARFFAYSNKEYGFTSRTVVEDGVKGIRVWRFR